MYVSLTSGHVHAKIEVESREDPEENPDIVITCYPAGLSSIYISLSLFEAEELVKDLQKELDR